MKKRENVLILKLAAKEQEANEYRVKSVILAYDLRYILSIILQNTWRTALLRIEFCFSPSALYIVTEPYSVAEDIFDAVGDSAKIASSRSRRQPYVPEDEERSKRGQEERERGA